MIYGNNVSLTYQKKQVLKRASFEIPKGRIVAFIGRSGAGKTSLLKCMAHLNPGFSGEIISARKVGFVFQQHHLFPHMTVQKNCMHPLLKVLNWPLAQARAKAEALLKLFGIQQYADSYPSQLSGGEQQRVALARAMCLEPEVLLFDEPTAALDPENTKVFVGILKKLQQEGVTIVVSTHDLTLLRAIVDKVYFLEAGEIVETYDVQTDNIEDKPKISAFLL